MVPRPTRRTLLRSAGLALTAGLAGCEFRRDAGDGTGDGNGQTDTQSTTVAPGASYDIVLKNTLTEAALRADERMEPETAASIAVAVEENYAEREDVTVFERQRELSSESSQTFEEAFATEADGPEYVVSASLEPIIDPGGDQPLPTTHTGASRFTPGEFGAPTETTFWISVHDSEDREDVDPFITVLNRPQLRPPNR
jgi:hypothetical protein